MRILDYFNMALKNIRRDGRNFISMTMIILALLLILCGGMLSDSIKQYEKQLQSMLEYREILLCYKNDISSSEMIEKVKTIPNVTMAYPNKYNNISCMVSAESLKNQMCFIRPCDSIEMHKMIGRKLQNNEIIIPKEIKQTISGEEEKILDLFSLVGNEINVKVDVLESIYQNGVYQGVKKRGTKEYTYKVVGTYEKKGGIGYKNDCFLTFDNIEAIYQECNISPKESTELCITVNQFSNTKKVWKELEEQNLMDKRTLRMMNLEEGEILYNTNFYIASGLQENTINTLHFVSGFSSIILVIVAISIFVFVHIKQNKEKEFSIGIMKAEGYQEKQVKVVGAIEIFCMITICFIIAVLCFEIIKVGINIVIDQLLIHVESLSMSDFEKLVSYSKVPKVIKMSTYFMIYGISLLIGEAITIMLEKNTTKRKNIDLLKNKMGE